MNLKAIGFLVCVIISSSAFAADSVTCQLTSLKNKSISATLPLSAVDADGVSSEGDGLNIGKDNYSFDFTIGKKGSSYELSVVFYENNNVQDEVGSISCKFNPKTKGSEVCKEAIQSDSGKVISNFSCKVH